MAQIAWRQSKSIATALIAPLTGRESQMLDSGVGCDRRMDSMESAHASPGMSFERMEVSGG